MKRLMVVIILVVLFSPWKAMAHHGGVALAFGPGSPIETNSALTLPQGGMVLSTRVEHVEFRKYSFAEPENKDSFTFFNVGISYGVTPFLTGTLFVPYNIKRQDTLGSNRGIGDLKLLFNLGLNYDPGKGLGLNKQEDTATTLEGIKKTYFSAFGGFTLPTGKNRKELGGEIDPGMQPGFASPTFTLGMAATRQIAGPFTLGLDTSYEIFTRKDGFKFGNEWRLNLAGIYELYGKPDKFLSKMDGILELNLLNLARDEEGREKLRATGGTILYLSPGIRFSFSKLWNANLGLMVKFPLLKDLNEKGEQQGAEGREKYRAIVTLSFFF
ncbi:MAG: transporter [Thermodesulfobacteriota bacterium]|nr:transporter [Thermodesulfobacteriota bacterium]